MDEEALFLELLEISSPSEREARLAAATQGNEALRHNIEELLKLHEKTGDFLRGSPAAQTIASVTNEAAGMQIGPYKLLEQIGEGGFGIVFMAEQQRPVRRSVALKILKPGMDTRQVIARFEAERQALALMDHPNIAKVFDAGATDSGRPYFVMELVKGIPITEYCDANQLAPRQRLELFVEVCHAVQHAHQKGIIHRDIKPGNVLVTQHDGIPVVKVIDFGVAKALGQHLTENTVHTGFAQMIGTPLYMSPEQAELSGLDVDTRSDIYSLGVLLYELLTGTTPFDKERLKSAAFDEIRRIIREEEPPKPSTRLSDLSRVGSAHASGRHGTNDNPDGGTDQSFGSSLASIAALRQTEPRRLSQLVRGDLDWIVMKSLEKDRTRRYETANGFALDIQRYLADEPVQACPPSSWYRFRKFARRNRVAFTTILIVGTAILLGTAVSVTQAIRATRAEQLAQARLITETKARYEADTARLAEGEQRREAERQRALAEENFEKAHNAVDDYFNTVSESKLLEATGLEPLRKELLESALNYYEGFVAQNGDDPGRLADLAAARLRVTMILYSNGERVARWFPHMQQAVEILARLIREGRDTPDVQRKVAGWFRSNTDPRNWQGGGDFTPEERAATDRVLKQGAEIWEKFVRDNPSVPEFQSDLAGIYFYVAANKIRDRKFADGTRALERAREILEKLSHEYPQEPRYRLDLASAHESLGMVQINLPFVKKEGQKNYQKALALREQVVEEFPQVASYRTKLGLGYSEAAVACPPERRDEAEQLSRKALDQFEKVAIAFPTMPSARFDVAREYQRLGNFLIRGGKQADGAHLYGQAISLFEALVSESPEDVTTYEKLAECYQNLINASSTSGDPREVEGWFHRAMEIWNQLATRYPNAWQHRWHLAQSLLSRGIYYKQRSQSDKAVADFTQAISVLEKAIELNPNDANTANTLAWELATVDETTIRDPARAVALAKKAVELQPKDGNSWNTLGAAQYRLGDWKAAVEALNTSMKLRNGGTSEDWFFLAMAHWQLGNKDEARQWYDKALAWTQKNAVINEELRRFQSEAAELLGIAPTADGAVAP